MRSFLALVAFLHSVQAFIPHGFRPRHVRLQESEWTSDFDDFDSLGDGRSLEQVFADQVNKKFTPRQLSLGQDLVVSDFVGNLGFDEVTDWEYVSGTTMDVPMYPVQLTMHDSIMKTRMIRLIAK